MGRSVGMLVGVALGVPGMTVGGNVVGAFVGLRVGALVGVAVGCRVGCLDGEPVGFSVASKPVWLRTMQEQVCSVEHVIIISVRISVPFSQNSAGR